MGVANIWVTSVTFIFKSVTHAVLKKMESGGGGKDTSFFPCVFYTIRIPAIFSSIIIYNMGSVDIVRVG